MPGAKPALISKNAALQAPAANHDLTIPGEETAASDSRFLFPFDHYKRRSARLRPPVPARK